MLTICRKPVSNERLIKSILQHRMIDGLYLLAVIGCTCCFPLSDSLKMAKLGGREEGPHLKAMHGKSVIEMESEHGRKIITCQAWESLRNELHLP